MRKLPVTIALFVLLAPYLGQPVYAQSEFVYLVKSSGCSHKPTERSQSGFRIKGTKGLVTALHGIVDCREVKVLNRKGKILYDPLNIVSTDIDRDVALISSIEFDSLGETGLEVGELPQTQGENVRVYGHPYGIENLETTLATRTPVLVSLQQLLTDDLKSQLRQRGSPNHLIKVVSLQGTLLPGHSGAPILDKQNRVIGVANGGLKGGFAQICWAVPFKDIEWETPDFSRLKKLKETETHGLFSMEEASAILAPAEITEDFCSAVKKISDSSTNGYRSIVGEATFKDGGSVFQSTVKIPGSLSMLVYPDRFVSATMASSQYLGEIVSLYYRLEVKLTSCSQTWETMTNKDIGANNGEVSTYWREKQNNKNERPVIELSYREHVVINGIKQKPAEYSLKLWFWRSHYWKD